MRPQLPLKLGMHSCKELREAKSVEVRQRADRLSGDDLATFGTLGSLLPALDVLVLNIDPLSTTSEQPATSTACIGLLRSWAQARCRP